MFKEVVINYNDLKLNGHLTYGDDVKAWVIFAHGSGSSRKSKRNNWVAKELNDQGFGTFLFDLLTEEEDDIYLNRFNIPLLAERLIAATAWLINSVDYKSEKIAYFGASTGAAATLMAAAEADSSWPIFAIVSRGGRPDLAEKRILNDINAPTLLIVGGEDGDVIKLNQWAESQIFSSKLVIVPGASHLFEEPGALDEVVKLTADWFLTHLDRLESRDEIIHRSLS